MTNQEIEARLADVIQVAVNCGYVVTVELQPKQPLAMGNYTHVISVRPCRALAEPIERCRVCNQVKLPSGVCTNCLPRKLLKNPPKLLNTDGI